MHMYGILACEYLFAGVGVFTKFYNIPLFYQWGIFKTELGVGGLLHTMQPQLMTVWSSDHDVIRNTIAWQQSHVDFVTRLLDNSHQGINNP